MNVWLALSLILGVITLYLLIIEVFSVAFKLTGLATNKIKFQVASLFTGTGFTTQESELITNDERRRKIAVTCAYTGHIFSVVIMGLVINVFVSIGISISTNSWQIEKGQLDDWYFIVLYVTSLLFLLVLILKIPPVNKRFQKFLESIAINSTKRNRNTNIITVLDMYGKHAIAEVVLNNIPEFAKEVPLYEMGLTKEYSINILSIKRSKRVIEVTKDTMFRKGDVLVIYGIISDIKEAFVNSIKKGENVIVIDHSNEINLVNNYGHDALVEVYVDEVPEELVGVAMKDAKLNERYRITIGIIRRGEEYMYVSKDTVIQKGDTLTLFGPYKNIKMLFKNDDKEKDKAE